MSSPLEQAHKALAEIVGELSLTLVRGRPAAEDYGRWLPQLRRIVAYFERMEAATRGGKDGAVRE